MANIVGLLGLVFLCFGLIASYLLNSELYLFSSIHLLLGAILIFYFLFRGGLRKAQSNKLGKITYNFVYSLLFFVFIAALNLLVTKKDPIYFDSTKQKVYSLAPQTQALLSKLKSKVVIRGFFVGGEVDPDLKALIQRMLKVSTQLEWILIDPTKAPNLAEKYGINERGTLHFSFADESSDREVKVVRSSEEQDVVNAILKLTRGNEKKVYCLGGNLEDKGQNGFLFLKEAIKGENIAIEKLDLIASPIVPKDAAAIMILPLGREILEGETKAILDYLSKGGNALVTSDPECQYRELLSSFGISISNDVIVDNVVKLAEGATLVLQPLVNTFVKHPITEDFKEGIILTTANSIIRTANASNKVIELAFSGEKSWAESNLKLIFSDNPKASFETGDKKGPVCIAIASEEKGRIVAIGDSDFVSNLNIRQLYNRDFFLNSLNWVIGQEEALSIRASSIQGSTKKISEDELKKIFLFSGLLFPEMIILSGLVMWWRRR